MAITQKLMLFIGFGSLACVLAAQIEGSPGSKDLHNLPSFNSFISKYNRKYNAGTREYEMRRGIYEKRLQLAQRHNNKPDKHWTAVVNHLSDRTEAELSQLRGLRIMQSRKKTGKTAGVVHAHKSGQFLGQIKSSVLPTEKSWAHLQSLTMDVDQGACGSCWAIATSTMLRANAEIHGDNRSFATQELVDCTPNPHNCGGSGGCQGATVELAMNWVMDQGLETESQNPYTAMDGSCKKRTGASDTSLIAGGNDLENYNLEDMIAVGFHPAKSSANGGAGLGLRGWERLAENQYEPLMRAIAFTGPAAVSVSASGWQSYGAGIFNDCSADAIIDHAVTLIGYGIDKTRSQDGKSPMYWHIKNSWGLSWGENGNIRLLREEGNVHCGTDYQPKVGTACDGGPLSVPVCGMCGILYDAVVPYFGKA